MEIEKKEELKKWVVDNMFACEFGVLDEEQIELFLDLLEDNKDQPFMTECFTSFEKIKEDFKNK